MSEQVRRDFLHAAYRHLFSERLATKPVHVAVHAL